MTNLQEKQAIKNRLMNYRDVKDLSLQNLAAQIGEISEATLSHILNDKWENISESKWRRVWNHISENISDVVQTMDFIACFRMCNYARKGKFMIGVIGETGVGKTTALQAYAMQKNVYYISCEKSVRPKQFFISLLSTLGVGYEASLNEMINRIAKELNAKESPLLIIDEASRLTHIMIEYLQELRDKTNKSTGIILGGMPYFKAHLEKFKNKNKEGYPEFYRRINLWHLLKGLSKHEIRTICEKNGINDNESISPLLSEKWFGNLYNAILLKQITD